MTPIWLLDIDGVVNAFAPKLNTSVWPADQWVEGSAETDGVTWKLAAGRPVIDFITAAHESGRAEIRWHTTWQHEANKVSDVFGLPHFRVQESPEYASWDHNRAGGWWKLPAGRRAALEGRPLIWTDDDAAFRLRSEARAEIQATVPLLVIAPSLSTGLTRRHLRDIDEFLTLHAELALADSATTKE